MYKKKNKVLKKGAPDMSILIFTILLTIFGTIMIYNASAYLAQQEFGNQFYFLKLQTVWIGMGIILGLFIYLVDYHKIAKVILPLLLGGITLLILVLLFGKEINGAKRWFEINVVRIQPAEFIKPILIIYLAQWLAKYEDLKDKSMEILNKDAWKKVLCYSFIVSIVSVLIILQPDLGTALVICITAFIMFFLFAQNKYQRHNMYKIGLMGLITIGGLIAVKPYRLSRMTTYTQLWFTGEVADPRGAGYQLHQILIGIGSSGFWGKGFGQSRQRFGYLVENTAFTDSTFAVVLEEFGIISIVITIAVWLFFFFKGYQIAKNAPDQLGKGIAIGITIWLTIQALLNIAANIGIIPITGLPLPFLTYGGSSTFVSFIGIALLLNVSQYSNINSSTPKYVKFR